VFATPNLYHTIPYHTTQQQQQQQQKQGRQDVQESLLIANSFSISQSILPMKGFPSVAYLNKHFGAKPACREYAMPLGIVTLKEQEGQCTPSQHTKAMGVTFHFNIYGISTGSCPVYCSHNN
jgi:hypothetical protein